MNTIRRSASKKPREGGFVLLMVLSLAVMVMILASGMAFMAQSTLLAGGNVVADARARNAARAASESALSVVKSWTHQEQVQDGKVVSAPLTNGLSGSAMIRLKHSSPEGVLIQIEGSGLAEQGAKSQSFMTVRGAHHADPRVFSGVLSMQGVSHQGKLQLQNGAVLGEFGVVPHASGSASTVQVPVPEVPNMIQHARKPCDVQLGSVLIFSQVQAENLFPEGKTVCLEGALTLQVAVKLDRRNLQIHGQVLGTASLQLVHSTLLMEGGEFQQMSLSDSTVLSAGDLQVEHLVLPGGEASVVSGGSALLQVDDPAATGSLAVVTAQNLQMQSAHDLQALIWAGGSVGWSGKALKGAIAARGPIDLGTDPQVILDPEQGRNFIPGSLVYQVISQQ